MIKEEKYKHLVWYFLAALEKRFPGSGIIDEIGRNFSEGTVFQPETISPAESLLLSCWEEHPDVFSGTVYHPLASEPVGVRDDAAGTILNTLKEMFRRTHFDTWKAAYFFLWRFWQSECPADCRQFPADDRLPGSSVFLQQDINAVMEICRTEHSAPAFLLFQIGPVQSFIAAARSTRDLLSGSYLIAWLISSAMKSVCEDVCPGCIVFPNVRGQGIFDLQNRAVLEEVKTGAGSCWEKVGKPDRLLNPTLPNRFLALVPAASAAETARAAEKAIRDNWRKISDACFAEMCRLLPEAAGFRQRWEGQTEDYFQITWQTLPFPDNLPEEKLPENLAHFKQIVESDFRKPFDLSLFGWSLFFHDVSAQLAARRNTRDFKQFITDPQQELTPKDVLTGREEIIGTSAGWRRMLEAHDKETSFPFRANEHPYGAVTIIKRLWLSCWLAREKLPEADSISFLSTEAIAKGGGTGYVAVLALDGDGMGQWINGEKTPEFLNQLAPESRKFFSDLWKKRGWSEKDRLPVTPEYHLQFSAALANFANHEVRTIVEGFDGRLIYAGGDDVLALLPASRAVECAAALRQKFRETMNSEGMWLPGPLATLSCGIAVGHFKYPLQMLIEEAHRAEHRAKVQYKKNALAVSVFKRSGEIMEWGTSFDSAGLTLLKNFQEAMRKDLVSSRFANALAQLLAPYRLEKDGIPPDFAKILSAEFRHVCRRQSKNGKETPETLGLSSCGDYLQYLLEEGKNADFATLFLVGKFLLRGEAPESDETQNEQEEH